MWEQVVQDSVECPPWLVPLYMSYGVSCVILDVTPSDLR